MKHVALAFALLLSLAGCGEDKVEQKRRELLTPPDQVAIHKAKKEKAAVKDEEGELLPSDLVLGGFQVPRGFTLTKGYEHEWFLRSTVASAEATARYVQERVFTGKLNRTSVGGVRFESAGGDPYQPDHGSSVRV